MPSGTAAGTEIPTHTLRRDIQGLRALAVLVVILDHLLHWPSGGFVGVDVFFVISGFLITGILLREYGATEHISFVGFYGRRLRRIVPAATVVLIVATAASFFLFSAGRFGQTTSDALWAFLFVGNWNMAITGTDYFQLGLPPSPLQHYWSLSVEEQFYMVWPWMMLGLLFLASKSGWNARSRRSLVVALFAVTTIGSFTWSLFETATAPNFAYFSTFSRAWELGVGALLAALVPAISTISHRVRPLLGWAGLLGILASVLFITSDLPFPGPWALAPVLSTALVISAGTGASADYDRFLFPLTNRVSRYIGDISYSLYLWHFPVIILLLAVFPASSSIYLALCVVGTIGLASLSYHFVENAFRTKPTSQSSKSRRSQRRHGSRSRKSRLPAISVVLMSAVTAVLVVLAISPRTPPSAGSEVPPSPPSVTVSSEAVESCAGADFVVAESSRECDLASLPNVLVPSVDQLSEDTGIAYDCYTGAKKALKTCTYGSSRADALRVAVIGDSHAAALLPALVPGLNDRNWSLETFVGNGCQWKSPLGGNCEASMEAIKANLNSDPYDVIITTGARWVGGDREAASAAYAAAWNTAITQGTTVIAVGDVPGTSDDAIACVSRIGFVPNDNDCGVPKEVALGEVDPLIKAVELSPGAKFIDMVQYFCKDDFCPSTIGNIQLYRDTASHVTATYMKTVEPYLIAEIEGAFG
ncbi:MAG: acyltransferase family protein [Rhodoglobus sp.]